MKEKDAESSEARRPPAPSAPRPSSGIMLLPAVPKVWNLAWLPFLVRTVPPSPCSPLPLKPSVEFGQALKLFFFLLLPQICIESLWVKTFFGKSLRKTDEGQAHAIMKTSQRLQTSQGPSVGHDQEIHRGTAVPPQPLLHGSSALPTPPPTSGHHLPLFQTPVGGMNGSSHPGAEKCQPILIIDNSHVQGKFR